MDTKNIIFELRTKTGLSQEELAEKVLVTRQGYQYSFRFSKKTYLSMLWNAS